jgi:hypothetical protein
MATLGFYVFMFFFFFLVLVFFKSIFVIGGTLIIFCSFKGGSIVQIESLEIHCQLSGSLRGYVDFAL